MWRIIFSFLTFLNIWQFVYPFLIKFEIKLNAIKLKGVFSIKFFNKLKFEIKFRIKHGYIYLYFNNKERKEQLSNKNFNVRFVINLINQMYFRQQWLNFNFKANFGFVLDSCITANACGYIDVISKSLLAKIKNNKKSAHIFTQVEPKYNEDICNLRIVNEIRMSVVDIVYSFIYTIIYTRRDNEKSRKCKIR